LNEQDNRSPTTSRPATVLSMRSTASRTPDTSRPRTARLPRRPRPRHLNPPLRPRPRHLSRTASNFIRISLNDPTFLQE
jgi:hypothetical protein